MVHHCHRRALKNDIIDSDKIKLVYQFSKQLKDRANFAIFLSKETTEKSLYATKFDSIPQIFFSLFEYLSKIVTAFEICMCFVIRGPEYIVPRKPGLNSLSVFPLEVCTTYFYPDTSILFKPRESVSLSQGECLFIPRENVSLNLGIPRLCSESL